MQPLRGYDSLSLGNLLQGVAPAPLSPFDIQNTGPYDSAQSPIVPQRRSSLTQERFLALKQAIRRIAPHVPPDVLQRHYINQLAELSNPTADTLYPTSYDSPPQSDDTSVGSYAAPQSAQSAQSATASPFVQAAMARFGENANRPVQPISDTDTHFSTGNLQNSIQPAPLSAPNMMEDPVISEARARFATRPAARGHVQPVRTNAPQLSREYLQNDIASPSLSTANIASTGSLGKGDITSKNSETSSSPGARKAYEYAHLMPVLGAGLDAYDDLLKGDRASALGSAVQGISDLTLAGAVSGRALRPDPRTVGKYVYEGARWVPLLGAGLDVYDDISKGDYGWAVADGLLGLSDLTFTGALARGALRYGLKGAWKNGSKTWAATRPWLGKLMNLPPGTEVHHALVPQKYRDMVPEWLLNHPLNLNPMYEGEVGGRTTRQLHNAVHGIGKKRFAPDNAMLDQLLRIHYGWPGWAKVGIPAAAASAGGNVVKGAEMMGDIGAAYPDLYSQPMIME